MTGERWRDDGVQVLRGDQLDPNTAQTPGMERAAAINAALGLYVYEGIFRPLGMEDAHVARLDKPGAEVQGHLSNGRPTPAWDFPGDLAGAGGVRASLTDLVHYVEGELGTRKSAITPALRLTQTTVTDATPPAMAISARAMARPPSDRSCAALTSLFEMRSLTNSPWAFSRSRSTGGGAPCSRPRISRR